MYFISRFDNYHFCVVWFFSLSSLTKVKKLAKNENESNRIEYNRLNVKAKSKTRETKIGLRNHLLVYHKLYCLCDFPYIMLMIGYLYTVSNSNTIKIPAFAMNANTIFRMCSTKSTIGINEREKN